MRPARSVALEPPEPTELDRTDDLGSTGLEPTEDDVDLAVAAQSLLGAVALRRAAPDEPACASCRHFLDPSAAIAYCWHPDHRALVDAGWRCDHHAEDGNR